MDGTIFIRPLRLEDGINLVPFAEAGTESHSYQYQTYKAGT